MDGAQYCLRLEVTTRIYVDWTIPVLKKPSFHQLRLTICLLCPLFAFAYFVITSIGASSSTKLNQDLALHFFRYQTIQLDAAAVAAQVRRTNKLSLSTSDTSFDLELTPHDLRTAGYRAEAFGAGSSQPVDVGAVRTFKGTARGSEKGEQLPQLGAARFTIDEQGLNGLIITPAERYYVEPARNYSAEGGAADYVIYKESDVLADSSGACGVTLNEQVNYQARTVATSNGAGKSQVLATAAPLQELRIATEADNEYVVSKGGAAAADQAILGLMNQVEGLYEIELGLTIKVVYQSAWSTTNDPYSSTNPSALLGELTDYWNSNRGSVARDVVHMWTGKDLDNATIGTAYLEALCRFAGNGRAAYGLSKGVTGAQQIAITAHEIGHNLGATHPNQQVPPVAECNNTVMTSSVSTNPQLNFCSYSRDEIARYLTANASCLSAGASQLSFAVEATYPVGLAPFSVLAADFNGDGKQDLAVANFDSDNVGVQLGADNGTLQPAVNYPVGHNPIAVAVGDFNGDGKLDLVTANVNSNNVSVLLGTGGGAFQLAVNFPAGAGPLSVAVGDFNGDSKLDLAVTNNSGGVGVLLGTGSGAFALAANYPVGARPESVAVGDFNNDGKLDLAVANYFSGSVSVLLGTGSGTFQPALNYAAHVSPSSVAVGDFNGDGKPDLAVANNNSDDVSVLLGTGSGTFQAAVNYAAGSSPSSVAVGDFNGDGKPDLAVANNSGGDVSVLLGAGNGAFQAAAV